MWWCTYLIVFMISSSSVSLMNLLLTRFIWMSWTHRFLWTINTVIPLFILLFGMDIIGPVRSTFDFWTYSIVWGIQIVDLRFAMTEQWHLILLVIHAWDPRENLSLLWNLFGMERVVLRSCRRLENYITAPRSSLGRSSLSPVFIFSFRLLFF